MSILKASENPQQMMSAAITRSSFMMNDITPTELHDCAPSTLTIRKEATIRLALSHYLYAGVGTSGNESIYWHYGWNNTGSNGQSIDNVVAVVYTLLLFPSRV